MEINDGNTAWVLISAALVMLMTPGLAFFYGGMTRAKGVLNMLMMSFTALGVMSVLWVLFGYALTFGKDTTGGLIGFTSGYLGLEEITKTVITGGLPDLVFVAFQLMFAVITVALISGAIADRAKFGGWVAFVVLWGSLVYFPVAHWVFYFGELQEDGTTYENGGWIVNRLGALDFAGGTAVHINAGAAALALVIVLGKRRGFGREPMRPHNLPLVMVGAGLLWFGWFGFNAGSALKADGTAGLAFLNTQVATGAALLAWILTEKIRDGHATTLGAASGAVAGLVAITPACAFVTPLGAVLIGLVAGVLCALAVTLKHRLGYDDSLDVVGVHLVGGLVGTLMIGLVASDTATGSADLRGLLYGGGASLLGKQAIAAFAVMGYSFVLALVIGLVIRATIGFRIDEEDEVTGIDRSVHAESAYELTGFAGGGGGTSVGTGGSVPTRPTAGASS